MNHNFTINVLSAKDIHGKDIKHLNPNQIKLHLKLKRKKRHNYSPDQELHRSKEQ